MHLSHTRKCHCVQTTLSFGPNCDHKSDQAHSPTPWRAGHPLEQLTDPYNYEWTCDVYLQVQKLRSGANYLSLSALTQTWDRDAPVGTCPVLVIAAFPFNAYVLYQRAVTSFGRLFPNLLISIDFSR